MPEKHILDACCGSRMFWFDKQNANTTYMDLRELNTTLCDGRKLVIAPDIIGDFREMPFPDASFSLVVFDPPHLLNVGKNSWLRLKYGALSPSPLWKYDIKRGIDECMRVLKPAGTLVFKWSEAHIRMSELLDTIAPWKPLFGNKTGGRALWLVFNKSRDCPGKG